MKKVQICYLCLIALLFVGGSYAGGSVGDFAKSLMAPVQGTMSIVRFLIVIAGASFAIASLIKFKEYYCNQTDMDLSTIITMFIVGLALIGLLFLPFIH